MFFQEVNNKADLTKSCIIADDVRASRQMLGMWLNEFGYKCTLVADGQAARLAAEAECPDLIITDIEMPRCNGIELLVAIRSHAMLKLRNSPIIVVSSLRDDQMVELVSQFGASCVLSKPLEKLRVKKIVRTLEAGNEFSDLILQSQVPQDSIGIPDVSPKLRRMAEEVSRENLP